jgi:hypothetical protein
MGVLLEIGGWLHDVQCATTSRGRMDALFRTSISENCKELWNLIFMVKPSRHFGHVDLRTIVGIRYCCATRTGQTGLICTDSERVLFNDSCWLDCLRFDWRDFVNRRSCLILLALAPVKVFRFRAAPFTQHVVSL